MDSNIKEQIEERVHADWYGRIIYVTISGSHLYGFESPDSDIDYRGCYQIPTINFLGLNNPNDHIDIIEGNTDCVLFELKKELGLIEKGNCNVLEHLFAVPEITSLAHMELLQIAHSHLNLKGIYNSYRGMAHFNYNKYIKGEEKPLVKKYLYVCRALLAGCHALDHKKIEPNLQRLVDEYDCWRVNELIQMKKDSFEKVTTTQRDDFNSLINSLDEDLYCRWEEIDQNWEWHIREGEGEILRQDLNMWLLDKRRELLD